MSMITMKQAINDALRLSMSADEKVILMGEDIQDSFGGVYQVTKGLSTEFGNARVINTPIAEAAIIGLATGSAMLGYRPIAEIMIIDFLGVCMDQLYNQAAKLRYMSGGSVGAPMVVRTTCGAGGGFGAQHSQSLEAWLCHVPGLKVVMPSNASDAKGLLLSAIKDEDPVVFIEPRRLYGARGECADGYFEVPLGKAIVRESGTDCTIVTWGRMVPEALIACETLRSEGISIEVIDLRTLVPLDVETIIESVTKTGRAVIAHEAVERGGYGAEVAAVIHDQAWAALRAPVQRVGALNIPVPYSEVLEDASLPRAKDIIVAIQEVLKN